MRNLRWELNTLPNLVPRAHESFGQRQDTECLGADQKTRGLWERDCTLPKFCLDMITLTVPKDRISLFV